MIPSHWAPHRRTSDDEVVGYLVPADDDGLVVPTSLLGHPLAGATEPDEAAGLLERAGLALLAEPWRFRAEDAEVRVEVVSVDPARAVVRSVDLGDAADTYGTTYVVDLPAGDALRPR